MKKLNYHRNFVSIIIPVYNAGNFLVAAINSILKQTYKNFELLIIDDGSTDNSWDLLKQISKIDKRIKLIQSTKNVGISKSLNKLIEKAKGSYLVRMDADDIAHPKRIEKQIDFLLENKGVVAVGTQCYLINQDNKCIGKKRFPTKAKEIYDFLFRFNPLQHPTIAINRNKLPLNFQYYDVGYDGAEDLNLIFKLFQYGRVENLKEFLHDYRIHNHNSSLCNIKKIYVKALLSRINGMVKYNYKPSILAIVTTMVQTIIVFLLPERLLFSLYIRLRHLNKNSNKNSLHNTNNKYSLVKFKAIPGLQ